METALISDIVYCAGFGDLLQPNRPAKAANIPTAATTFLKNFPFLDNITVIERIAALRAEFRGLLTRLRLPAAFIAPEGALCLRSFCAAVLTECTVVLRSAGRAEPCSKLPASHSSASAEGSCRLSKILCRLGIALTLLPVTGSRHRVSSHQGIVQFIHLTLIFSILLSVLAVRTVSIRKLQIDLAKPRRINQNLHLEFIAVFIPWRVVAYAFSILSFLINFVPVFLDIRIAGSHLRQ